MLKRIDLPTGLSDALLTPDGARLLVVSLTDPAVTIIDTLDDTVIARVPLNAPANSIVANVDSTRAYAASPTGALITAINLERNLPSGTLTLPGTLNVTNLLSMSPSGLLYIVVGDYANEIDPRTLRRISGRILARGIIGRPLFTPDGRFIVLPSVYDSVTARPVVFIATLFGEPSTATWTVPNTLDRVRIVSNSMAVGYSTSSRTFYRFGFGFPDGLTPITQLAPLAGQNVAGFGGTNESPQTRHLFLSSGNAVYRMSAATQAIAASHTLTSAAGIAIAPSVPSYAAVAKLQAVGPPSQTVTPGATSLPLIVRALDANDRPVGGADISFYSSKDAQLAKTFTVTNADGYAETAATLPNSASGFSVGASNGNATTYFSLRVALPSGQIGPGKMTLASGDGQILYSPNIAPGAMSVRLTNEAGTAYPGVPVDWTIVTGGGRLRRCVGAATVLTR